MKKTIFTIFLFSVVVARAQFDKGEKFIGGNVNLGFSTSSNSQINPVFSGSGNNTSINVNSQLLKAANQNTLRGISFGLGFGSSTYRQNDLAPDYIKTVSNGLSANVGYTIRKYKPLWEKLFWYMEYDASVGYRYIWQKNSYLTGNTKSYNSGYNISVSALPALCLKANDRFLVDVNFGGLSTGYDYNMTANGHSSNYNVQLNLTSRLTLGILWKLKKSARS